MSKALKAGKKPLYEHPWIQDSPDSSEEYEEIEQQDIIEEEEIEDDPQA